MISGDGDDDRILALGDVIDLMAVNPTPCRNVLPNPRICAANHELFAVVHGFDAILNPDDG